MRGGQDQAMAEISEGEAMKVKVEPSRGDEKGLNANSQYPN